MSADATEAVAVGPAAGAAAAGPIEAAVVAPANAAAGAGAAGGLQDADMRAGAGLRAAAGVVQSTAASRKRVAVDALIVDLANGGAERTGEVIDKEEQEQQGERERRQQYGGVGMEGMETDVLQQQQGQGKEQQQENNMEEEQQQQQSKAKVDFLRWDAAKWAQVLQRETQLRLSPETQAKYAAAEKRQDTDWMEVTGGLQEDVLREQGVREEQLPAALRAMRTAPYKYPQLKKLCIYHKYQRSRQGPAVGSTVPNVMMVKLPETGEVQEEGSLGLGGAEVAVLSGTSGGEMVPLLSCFVKPEQQLLVIFAGSYS